MPTVFQICVEGNRGSTGRIAENIGLAAMDRGWRSIIAYGRFPRPSRSEVIRIGGQWDVWAHGLQTRLFDRHGLASESATRRLVQGMTAIKPDIIHLHHLHGYYVNIEILFGFLGRAGVPVVWTFHDCWSVTGHCAYFDLAGCNRWKSECHDCPQKRLYPASWLFDRSTRNHREKRALFRSVERMTIVPVSRWLSGIVGESFLAGYPRRVIHNGIDLKVFSPDKRGGDVPAAAKIENRFIILGVANVWAGRKGLQDFIRLSERVDEGTAIVLVGLSPAELKRLPKKILGLGRTENQAQLAALYANAGAYLNPTWEDSFPTTNLEALACGTPVITYRTGGSPESVTDETGYVVDRGDIDGLRRAVEAVKATGKDRFSSACRERAVALYDRDARCAEYVSLYEELMRPAIRAIGSVRRRASEVGKVYRVCSNCIMDTSAPGITFDERGWCDYCRNYQENIVPHWHTDERGGRELMDIAERIRRDRKGRAHDCIIGLSGGPDSSYAAFVAKKKMGLNPLIYHVDAGWDNQQAVGNIEKMVNGLGLDLYTEVIDWEEMKDLQVAFLRSQIPDQDYPQDMAFFSGLYRFARKNRIKFILTGANYSTECVREPEAWGAYVGIDRRLVNDIHRRFGRIPLRTFPIIDVFEYKVFYRYGLGMKVVSPLNYVPYVKKDAERELADRFGWQAFIHKHHESRFTIFYESYWLPRKFNFDKRRAHFSSLILTNQMSRAEALERIARPEVDELTLEQEFEYVAGKLGLSVDELREIFRGENRTASDYRNKKRLITLGTSAMRSLGLEKRRFA